MRSRLQLRLQLVAVAVAATVAVAVSAAEMFALSFPAILATAEVTDVRDEYNR